MTHRKHKARAARHIADFEHLVTGVAGAEQKDGASGENPIKDDGEGADAARTEEGFGANHRGGRLRQYNALGFGAGTLLAVLLGRGYLLGWQARMAAQAADLQPAS